MIHIETPNGPKLFTKAVFVWTGHVISGWPTSFHNYIYSDEINGLLCYGHDDIEVEELSWWQPNGMVTRDEATCANPQEAYDGFKQLYGDRLILWMNKKEGLPLLSQFTKSDYVISPADLRFDSFTGTTRSEFKEWASQYLERISTDQSTIVLPKRV